MLASSTLQAIIWTSRIAQSRVQPPLMSGPVLSAILPK